MKWFRDRLNRALWAAVAVTAAAAGVGAMREPRLFTPGKGVARWIENVEAGSPVEAALYRMMQLPGGQFLFRRSPQETVPALNTLAQSDKSPALVSLRALEEEQALDFDSAERDWKTWAAQAEDKTGATLDLADFYERRLKAKEEIAAMEDVGQAAPDPRERWTAPEGQRSWRAWERALRVARDYALPRNEQERLYGAWVHRYPQQPAAYSRQFAFLLEGNEFAPAADVIAHYHAALPGDRVFPVKARADLAARSGQPKDGLAIYDAQFEPLWPAELVKSYFDLVLASHNQRALSDELHARLAAHSDDLKDAARLFYLYQQQGQMDSAKAVFSHYREQKEAQGSQWSSEELNTLEQLFEAIQDFPEAARYAYALASDKSSPASERLGTVALARILLTAPEQPLRVGSGNLRLYQSIATMDRGPGYLNGILSLLLNTQGPRDQFTSEEQIAVPYFHRARAAELIAEIDRRFPDEPELAHLHASLMEAYAVYGENDAIIREGTQILAQFPTYKGRVHVAIGLADAYSGTGKTDREFAVYQSLLKELASAADAVPLGDAGDRYSKPVEGESPSIGAKTSETPPSTGTAENDAEIQSDVNAGSLPQIVGARSAQYSEVLNRYLARLVSLKRLPEALTALRGELDRNPDDPGLYAKLADFLEQNSLASHQEEVYQQAIARFQERGWYAKLARFYLREKRQADYRDLMRKVAGIFSGTELEEYLDAAPAPNRSMALQVNLYAHERFPHELRFVERLIPEYTNTHRESELEKLLWEHWTESPDLRNRLFEILSKSNRLDAHLAQLRQQAPEIDRGEWTALARQNPVAERFWLESCLWQSSYEEGVAAADALSTAYPADPILGEETSSLYRSLAYFHAEDTEKAVTVEKRLLSSDPGNVERLARIGDIYADREQFASAIPYWQRMTEVRPGQENGYLQSATVFWDYFDFASAKAQIEHGRGRLSNPSLLGYQAGAIEESRGDLPAAVREYTASAIAGGASTDSRDRLLSLARRPALRGPVEDGTARLLKQDSPSSSAIQLRAGVLEGEHRSADLDRELKLLIARTGSFDVLDAITETARSHALAAVEEAAIRRQVALTTDPVRNLQLRYQLVDLLQNSDRQSAAKEIDTIYAEHGKILGVVRSTVDYNWNHDRRQQAVQVLLESAKASYPDLRSRFELESARKLTDIGDFAQSKGLLANLLVQKPLGAGYEAAMADNLARANDQAGLAAFYTAQLGMVLKASLDPDEKQSRIGQLRRGMIAADVLIGHVNDAIDQYIELINTFSDDAGLVQEAALFAGSHGTRDRLFAFYQKTVSESPRDPRWSIVLARLATAAEDPALAIDSYDRAIRLRPERQDLYIAEASLQVRVRRFDDAIAIYRKLYALSYRDPKWMDEVAELCARQGRQADAVRALETAYVEGRPAQAANQFKVAERLEAWGLLEEARKFAAAGVAQAGPDLLVDASNQAGAATYARILTRLRQAGQAVETLRTARTEAPHVGLVAIATEAIKSGPGAVTASEWRQQREQQRAAQATDGFARALKSMGSAVGEFYTPEEKAQFATLIRQCAAAASNEDAAAVYLPAINAASLVDLVADLEWRLAQTKDGSGHLSTWIELQRTRVQMDVVGARLEKLATARSSETWLQVMRSAASAYQDAGDTTGELRTLEQLADGRKLEDEETKRYYRLLLAQRPQQLLKVAESEDSAAQYLVVNAKTDQALQGIAARSGGRPDVWRAAFFGLTGLYRGEHRPEVKSAFSASLNAGADIGARVASPVDRDHQLAGDVWFYYGSRYGEYLDEENDSRAGDFLDANLEKTPESPGAYLRTAAYSARAGRVDAALADYRYSLDLHRDQPAALNQIAVLEWSRSNHADAVSAWGEAINQLAEEMDSRGVPETFWSDFENALNAVVDHKQFDAIRQPVDTMLRTYLARNGDYRVEPLLRAGYHANNDSIEWLLAITASASEQASVLYAVLPNSYSDQGHWLTTDKIARIREHILELAERKSQTNPRQFDQSLDLDRQRYVEALLELKDPARAQAVMARVPEQRRNSAEWMPFVLHAAQLQGSLPALIAQWIQRPTAVPSDDILRAGARELSSDGRRIVMRFVYERALERRELTAPNFLGLAAIHLDENDVPGAMQLLKRLTLVSSNLYPDMDAAALLLEKRQRPAEAREFLEVLAVVSPWDASYRVRLSVAMLAAHDHPEQALNHLSAVASDPQAPYSQRVKASTALKASGKPANGSEELKLLSQPQCPAIEAVAKPYFAQARLAAALCVLDGKAKEHLLSEAIAFDPRDARTRLQYIWSAFALNYDSRALIAAQPYLQPAYSYSAANSRDDSSTDSEDAESTSENSDDGAQQSVSLGSLPAEEMARLLQLAAATYERRRDLQSAARICELALQSLHDDQHRKLFTGLRERFNAEQERISENEARAPGIHAELTQDHDVQPRLLPGMAAPKRARKSGEVEE